MRYCSLKSRTVYYTTYVAEKSDGFIPVNRTKWSAGQSIYTNPASAVDNANINFDGGSDPNGDGGYNHSELRNLKRNYGQKGNSEPMQAGKFWISDVINR